MLVLFVVILRDLSDLGNARAGLGNEIETISSRLIGVVDFMSSQCFRIFVVFKITVFT